MARKYAENHIFSCRFEELKELKKLTLAALAEKLKPLLLLLGRL